MQNLYTLIDAICEAYDDKAFRPRDGKTYCNQAVAYVADRMGWEYFRGQLANDIVFMMERDPRWKKTTAGGAQAKANAGYLVVAGRYGKKHGHVAVVRPGFFDYSAKWRKQVPKVLDIGKNMRIARGANWAFRDPPGYWWYTI